jgi:hypothetical protein
MKTRHMWLIFSGVGLVGLAALLRPNSNEMIPASKDTTRLRVDCDYGPAPIGESRNPLRPRKERQSEPKPWRAHAEAIARYSEETKENLNFYDSDHGMSYKRQGFLNYYELMREALQGDQDSLASIFDSPPTDGAASEGFSVDVTCLIEQLGDSYFAHQLSKQPPKVQRRIIRSLWRGDFDKIAEGYVPYVGEQLCPHTGQLATKINDAEQAVAPNGP